MLTSSKKINKHKIISFKVRFIRGVSVEAASFGNFGDGDAGPAANADEGSGDEGGKTADSRGRKRKRRETSGMMADGIGGTRATPASGTALYNDITNSKRCSRILLVRSYVRTSRILRTPEYIVEF